MDFYNVLEQVLALLQRHQRVTYRAVQRQFGLDEEALADLKDELLYAHPEVRDDAGRGLVWTGELAPLPPPPRLPWSPLARHPSPTPRPISRRRSSRPAAPWKASASRSRYCLRT